MSTKKEYSVCVNFKKNSDFSNPNKRVIIDSLAGIYKESLEALNDMNNKNVHKFSFSSKEVADNFANRLFDEHSQMFNIEKLY